MTLDPRSWLVAAALLVAALLGACAPTTWRQAADQALKRAERSPEDATLQVAAGELALLGAADPNEALNHLKVALLRAPDGSPVQGRAALAAIQAASTLGNVELVRELIAETAPALSDPLVAEAVVGTAGTLWGALGESGAAPGDLLAALDAVAKKRGLAWEPARTEALAQLLTSAELASPMEVDGLRALRERSGLITSWRLSAPWGEDPELDLYERFGPESRPLADRETTTDGFATLTHATWRMEFSDGEVTFYDLPPGGALGFAEAWVALDAGEAERRAVLAVESNVSFAVYANRERVLLQDRIASPGASQSRVGLVLPSGAVRLLVVLAAPEGRGFFRARLTHADGAPIDLHARRGPLSATVATFDPPSSFVETFRRPVRLGDGAAAVRALLALDALIARPVRDLAAADELLASLGAVLGPYPGLGLARRRLYASDDELPRQVRDGRSREALRPVLEAWPDSAPALRDMARLEARAGRNDEALALWRRAARVDPAGVATTVGLLNYYVERGWEAEALKVAQQLDSLVVAGPRVSQELIDAYRRFGLVDRAVEATRRLESLFPAAALTRLASFAGDAGECGLRGELLLRAWRRAPQRLNLVRQASQAFRAAGQSADAVDALNELLDLRPEDAWALGEKVRMALEARERGAALVAIDGVLAAHPSMDEPRDLASWLRGVPPELATIADGREIVKRWREQGEESPHPVATLLDRTAIRVEADGSYRQLRHVIKAVRTKAGADGLGEIRPPRGAELLVVRTLKSDGRVLWPDRVEGKPDLSFTDLQPGDAVEHAWLLRGVARPEEGGYLTGISLASWDAPILDKEVEVSVAPELVLQARAHNGAPEPQVEEAKDGWRTWRWTARDLPAVPREPYAASPRTFFPYVDLTVAAPGGAAGDDDSATWHAIARSYAAVVRRLVAVGPRVRAIARKIRAEHAKGKPGDPDDLARAAFDMVKRDVTLSESYNDFATPAEAVALMGEGSRVVLLLALLRALDVPADLLLCAPRDDGAPPDAARPLPAANRFYYPVVRVHVADPPVLLDPSQPYHPYAVLPATLSGARCLLPGAAANDATQRSPWVELPDNVNGAEMELGWELDVDLTLTDDGSASGAVEGFAFGPAVNGLRVVYLNADEARRDLLFQQWAASLLPGARVLDSDVLEVRDADEAMAWRVEVEIPNLMRREGDTLASGPILPPLIADRLSAVPDPVRLVALAERQTPLRVPSHIEKVVLRIAPPPGRSFDTVPANITVDLPLARFSQQVERVPEGLEIVRDVRLRPGRVAPGAYPRFREQVARALDAFGQGLTLR